MYTWTSDVLVGYAHYRVTKLENISIKVALLLVVKAKYKFFLFEVSSNPLDYYVTCAKTVLSQNLNLQQPSSSDPSIQSCRWSHQLSALIHACESLHRLSSENGHGLEAKVSKY